jgi:hypothetical protein
MTSIVRRSARIATKAQAMAQPTSILRAVAVKDPQPMFQDMDDAGARTSYTIRRMMCLLTARADPDELTADALVSLRRAIWAIEDAIEFKMKQNILKGDVVAVESVPAIVALLVAVDEELNRDITVFSQYRHISRSLVVAAQSIGSTIISSFYPN